MYALTTHQLQWRGERDIEPIKCMRSTTHQLQVERRESHRANEGVWRSPHTSYRWERERHRGQSSVCAHHTLATGGEGERGHRATQCMRSPHTSYRWRGERDIEPIKCMRSPHTSYRWRGERDIEPIKCMRSPHTSYRWRGERDNQVYALTTHQLQVERRERQSSVCAHHTPATVERRKRVIEPMKCLVTPFKRLIHSGTKHVIAQSQRRKTVFGIIFVVEIEQKQAIWCLKRKSLN